MVIRLIIALPPWQMGFSQVLYAGEVSREGGREGGEERCVGMGRKGLKRGGPGGRKGGKEGCRLWRPSLFTVLCDLVCS